MVVGVGAGTSVDTDRCDELRICPPDLAPYLIIMNKAERHSDNSICWIFLVYAVKE